MLAPWAVEITDRVDLEALRERVVHSDVEAAFPDRAGTEPFISTLRASVEENLSLLRAVLNGSLLLEDVQLHQPLVLGALQAQLRIPQAAMQRSYRVGFTVMWEEWTTALVERAPAEADPDLSSQVVELTRLILAYQDHVAIQVADRLSAEEQALNMSRAHVRHRLIEDVLANPHTLLSPADLTTIGYSLDLHHLAVLLPAMAEGAASRFAVGMADAAGTRHSLTLPRELSASVVWLGRATAWTTAARQAVRACLEAVGTTATLGEPGRGIDGFRESLAQAEEAEVIRRAAGASLVSPVLEHAEVGLEILLMRDRQRAVRFVRDELGALAGDTQEAARLRETLETSYRLGSHVATAAHLHVHEHTVRNRLRKVEEVLAHPLTQRSTEVQVALRLARLL
ncbi:helix-turn-helix domain-containing protein [Nocardioides sp. W7]|uniref:PucR family transcriptional regulator n=1 Tax=Nocardioides sp. W7 TaxID=2931390 RepID=UPI001FD4BD44|nr:helix-turn-helix domain-containing protein [Nocardioides sp. W7]